MSASESRVSVVIPTFNRRASLAKVIDPVLEDASCGEVIVVIDGCTDGSFEFLSEWALREPRLRVLFQENGGEAKARRSGIKEARFDTVVLLDDDVKAHAGLIGGHARSHVGSDHRLVVGYMPTIVPTPRRSGQATTLLYGEYYEATCRLYQRDSSSIFTHLWAGNISIRRDNALAVASDAEGRLGYHEDLKFGLQCRDAGLEAVFHRSLLAEHSHSRTLRKFSAECQRSGEAMARLMNEYPSLEGDLNSFFPLSEQQRHVARYLGTSFVRPLSAATVMAISYLSGRVRAWKTETRSARALHVIQLSFGFNRARKVLLSKTSEKAHSG
jgi:glycosyltransferase involved in cell wall biosynthesis